MALGCSERFHRSAFTEVSGVGYSSGAPWKAVHRAALQHGLFLQVHTLLTVE